MPRTVIPTPIDMLNAMSRTLDNLESQLNNRPTSVADLCAVFNTRIALATAMIAAGVDPRSGVI